MKSKMENLTQTFREKMNFVLELIEELQIKSKTAMSIGACDGKKSFFVTFILSEGIFFYYLFFLII